MGWSVYLRKRVLWAGQRLWSLVSGTALDLGVCKMLMIGSNDVGHFQIVLSGIGVS